MSVRSCGGVAVLPRGTHILMYAPFPRHLAPCLAIAQSFLGIGEGLFVL